MLMHQSAKGLHFSLRIHKPSFPFFVNVSNVSKHQASEEIVFTLFFPSFQLVSDKIISHDTGKSNSTLSRCVWFYLLTATMPSIA